MLLYAVSIFLGAFLLFLVQPMFAQFILPWFGGSSLVWTTCMLFFQSGLVLGYAYAHQVTQRLGPTTQWLLHLILVSTAVLFLPIRPDLAWKPVDGLWPSWRVLVLLTATIGVPYVVLSTTGPLLQRWQSLSHPHRSPYRLFALSNFGSLLALVGYPFLIDSRWTLAGQSWLWSAGFLCYALSIAVCGYAFQRRVLAQARLPETDEGSTAWNTRLADAIAETRATASPSLSAVRTGRWRYVLWLLLPMLASIQLLATTNFLTQEVGSHPFLWVLPLALYLISFILCFESERLYVRPVFFVGLSAAALAACLVFDRGLKASFTGQVTAYCSVLFFAAMVCHGELSRLKPSPRHLTAYYLCLSLGGAAGGLIVAVLAPAILHDYYEFHISLILVVLCTLPMLIGQTMRQFYSRPRPVEALVGSWFSITAGVVAVSGVSAALWGMASKNFHDDVVAIYRNEYGVLKVNDQEDKRTLSHGNTLHGFQVHDPAWHSRPTSYYGPGSGLGLAMRYFRQELSGDAPTFPESNAATGRQQPIRLAAIGLGTGTMATWGRTGDSIRFFEIDPHVVQVARRHFTYLSASAADCEVVLGDARLQLEREQRSEAATYDVLIADAFSSDSIPKHLLTTEALRIFLDRITPDGIVAIHVSNRFIELAPLLERQASDLGVTAIHVAYSPQKERAEDAYQYASSWVLLTRNPLFAQHPVVQTAASKFPAQLSEVRWTDDFAPLLPLLRDQPLGPWFSSQP